MGNMPLKQKYTQGYISSGGKSKAGGNASIKKKTIWKMIEENAKKRGGKK